MNMHPQVDSLVVSDFPLECREPDLLALAQSYGRVKSCEIKRDFRNHVVSAYGIISYFTLDSAEAAFNALHNARFMGKTLRSVLSSTHIFNLFAQQLNSLSFLLVYHGYPEVKRLIRIVVVLTKLQRMFERLKFTSVI
jgi:RNA recognition motif-containing protein